MALPLTSRTFTQLARAFSFSSMSRDASSQAAAVDGKLTDAQRNIVAAHEAAVRDGRQSYEDPKTGYTVFTSAFHTQRGTCCGNACRHCPYQHKNVPPARQGAKKFNGFFYE